MGRAVQQAKISAPPSRRLGARVTIAGTDGLESMRLPFTDESRTVVVLYREPWGSTEWTRVEETPIKERCLKHGWDSLFLVALDKGSTLPKWLPRTHVRFNYADFGPEHNELKSYCTPDELRREFKGGPLGEYAERVEAELIALLLS